MFIKNFLDYFESINEGLIKTHRGDLSVSYIVDTLKRLKFNINGDFNNDIIKIEFNEFHHIDSSKLDDLFDTISAVLTNKFGWFPSSMNIILTNGMSRLKKYVLFFRKNSLIIYKQWKIFIDSIDSLVD